MPVDAMELDPINGNVHRDNYIRAMRGVAEYAGSIAFLDVPTLERTGWYHRDAETGRGFDHLAGGERAETSAVTLNRLHELVDASTDESAEAAKTALRKSVNTGDNYQFSYALDESKGELRLKVLDLLIEHELMIGFPSEVIKWIERAGGVEIGTEDRGYDLGFFEEVWKLAQHPDIGLREKVSLAKVFAEKRQSIISKDTWDAEEGQQAAEAWGKRLENAQQKVDGILIAKARACIEDPRRGHDENSIHKLAIGIEAQMRDRWYWHYRDGDVNYAVSQVRGLVDAHLELLFVDAQTRVEAAEALDKELNQETGAINLAIVAIMRLNALLGLGPNGVGENRYPDLESVLTELTLGPENLNFTKDRAHELSRRVRVIRGIPEPGTAAARLRPFKLLFSKIVQKSHNTIK